MLIVHHTFAILSLKIQDSLFVTCIVIQIQHAVKCVGKAWFHSPSFCVQDHTLIPVQSITFTTTLDSSVLSHPNPKVLYLLVSLKKVACLTFLIALATAPDIIRHMCRTPGLEGGCPAYFPPNLPL